MDATEKRLYRRYITTRDSEDHARLISHAMRAGHIDRDKVALCAYLNDPMAQGLFFSFVRTNCFLYFDHALKNIEPADTFPHLNKWGQEATIKAGCGVIRALARKVYETNPPWFDDIGLFANSSHTYKSPRRPTERTGLSLLAAKYRFAPAFGLTTVASRAFNSLLQCLSRGFSNPGIGSCRIANGFLDDSQMWPSMLEYIKPWALGEYA